MTAQQFVSQYARGTAVHHFACRLISSTHTEQTEAHIALVARQCGLSECGREIVIGHALDAGLIRSSVVDARSTGFGFVPTLVNTL
jgi:hypothetical protein